MSLSARRELTVSLLAVGLWFEKMRKKFALVVDVFGAGVVDVFVLASYRVR